jgi:hypothetical protein
MAGEHYIYCLVSPIPNCSPDNADLLNSSSVAVSKCINCETVVDYGLAPDTGWTFCVVLTCLTCVFGIFGTISNCFTIFVILRKAKTCSFTTLLTVLSLYDLGICFGGSIYTPSYLIALGINANCYSTDRDMRKSYQFHVWSFLPSFPFYRRTFPAFPDSSLGHTRMFVCFILT